MALKAERSNGAVERLAADLAPCDSVLVNIETLPAGIVGTAIDGDAYALTIDYDPRRISDESSASRSTRSRGTTAFCQMLDNLYHCFTPHCPTPALPASAASGCSRPFAFSRA
jgi:hypothetical protein